jgi:hypothetical protein
MAAVTKSYRYGALSSSPGGARGHSLLGGNYSTQVSRHITHSRHHGLFVSVWRGNLWSVGERHLVTGLAAADRRRKRYFSVRNERLSPLLRPRQARMATVKRGKRQRGLSRASKSLGSVTY